VTLLENVESFDSNIPCQKRLIHIYNENEMKKLQLI
jgi:hypothetical protein